MLLSLLCLIALTLLLGADTLFKLFGAVVKTILIALVLGLAVYSFRAYPAAVLTLTGLLTLLLTGAAIYDQIVPADERQRRKEQKLAKRLGVEDDGKGGYKIKEKI